MPEPDQPQHDDTNSPSDDKPRRFDGVRRYRRRHPVRTLSFALGGLLVVAAVALWWIWSGTFEDTDDAQVDGHISQLGARVAGTVTAVHVEENQSVAAGQLLVELDPRDFQVAVERAEAQLAQAEAQLQAAHPNVPITSTTTSTRVATSADELAEARAALAAAARNAAVAEAQLQEAQARSDNAVADVRRYRTLVEDHATTAERYDDKVADARTAMATVEARRAAVRAARQSTRQQRSRVASAVSRRAEAQRTAPHQVAIQDATVESARAAVMAARAALDQAKLDLSYTRIVAPVAGVIGRRNVEPGARVTAGQSLLSVVQLADLWVTANYKETQLRRMRPGQSVSIHVDALDRDLDGVVESMPGASGARFSLLPPENATGNYVKVVQRLPVRIRFRPNQDPNGELRPGMSVVPKVWL